MKKQIVFLATLFFGVAVVQAEEQISSISFNPSRLGLFEQLRLTEGLTSHGNVTVENAINIRQNTGLKATNGLDVTDTIDAEQGRVTIPDTQLKVTGSMAVNGGFALFKGASTLGGLPANTWVHAPTLNLDTLTITGSNDGALLFDPDSYAQGLVLGGNDIPVPPNHSECAGDLAWVTRKAADGKTYDVLAVTECKESLACNTAAPACQVEKNGACVKKTCSGNKTLDTTDCSCKECDKTCSAYYSTLSSSACACVCNKNKLYPDASDFQTKIQQGSFTCYSIGNVNGKTVYNMGTIRGDATRYDNEGSCNIPGVYCDLPAVHFVDITPSGTGMKKSVLDAKIASQGSVPCSQPVHIGNRKYALDSHAGTLSLPGCEGASSGDPCYLYSLYECKSSGDDHKVYWGKNAYSGGGFHVGYPPCYPNCQ